MAEFIMLTRGFISVMMTVLHFFTGFIFGDFTAETKPLYENCKLNMAIISDIHMTTENARADILRFGLQDMQEFSSQLDALICSGDITDSGNTDQWDLVTDTFSGYTPAKNIILAQGNHDTWNDEDDYELSREIFIDYNKKIAGRDIENVYYTTKVNGYTFIVLGSESDHTAAYFSDTQLQWLDAQMKIASQDGLPIFVVSHWPINQTHGLPETWGVNVEPDTGGMGDQSAQIEEILKAYENVFLITGHVHNGLTNSSQESVFGYTSVESDGSFHSINLPSYMYLIYKGRISNGTGFTVEVYDDAVELRARSFSSGVWYTDYNYTIELV